MKVAILRDHNPQSSAKWEESCEKTGLEYKAFDLLQNNWFDDLNEYKPDLCLNRPPGDIRNNKVLYDERIFFLESHSLYPIFPGFLATYIYENKSALAWFLKTNQIPHPKTYIFTLRNEAKRFSEQARYPIVGKTLIGASGSGVKIIANKSDAQKYIRKAFSSGIRRRFGPNKKAGNPKSWLQKAIKSPRYLISKIRLYTERYSDSQKDIVLFQEYIYHNYEWRIAKIGGSFFAYKKLAINNYASGSKQFEFEAPPLELLNFTKELCDRFGFIFMTVDLFYNEKRIYVNELQTIFGHKNEHICKVNNVPGRYQFKNNKWIFEEGSFNTNESYDLRLVSAINSYKKNE